MNSNEKQMPLELPISSMAELEGSKVQRVFHQGQWWFVILDIIEVLTGSPHPKTYWAKMQERENIKLYPNREQFYALRKNGREYKMDFVNMAGALRLIQSIPSPKAEPFKQWLAKVGQERMEEDANPTLADRRVSARNVEHFLKKGMTLQKAQSRVKGIRARNNLTDALQARGVESPLEFAKYTSITHQGTFGMPVKAHKALKGLKPRENLRDNMVYRESSFTGIAEDMVEKLLSNPATNIDEAHQKVATAMRKMRESYETAMGVTLATPDRPGQKALK